MTRGYLLDTHVLIWALAEPRKLKKETAAILESNPEVWVSAGSIWEIGIKTKRGKMEFEGMDVFLEWLKPFDFKFLNITPAHAQQAAGLDLIHQDPFDRMLVAQALEENLTLISADGVLPAYGIKILVP